jgi:hypothetical protein
MYEVKWMIWSAAQLPGSEFGVTVALADSAAVHARNLLEFVNPSSRSGAFHIEAFAGGRTTKDWKEWEDFLNNRFTHMGSRESRRVGWPAGLTNDRSDRLLAMAGAVLDALSYAGQNLETPRLKFAYDELLRRGRLYVDDPSPENHDYLHQLFDASREDDTYSGPKRMGTRDKS